MTPMVRTDILAYLRTIDPGVLGHQAVLTRTNEAVFDLSSCVKEA